MCSYLFFIAEKQQTISFLIIYYQRFSSLLVRSLLQSNALALFTNCVIKRIFTKAEMEYKQSKNKARKYFVKKHFTFMVRCFFIYDISHISKKKESDDK